MKLPTSLSLAIRAHDAGGFTVRFEDGAVPTEGFAVSFEGYEQRLSGLTHTDIDTYLRKLKPLLPAALAVFGPELCLGAWLGDAWYLDISIVCPSLEDAFALARANGQRAVYDVAGCASIAVPYYGVA